MHCLLNPAKGEKIISLGGKFYENVTNTESCNNLIKICIESDDIKHTRPFKYALCNFS